MNRKSKHASTPIDNEDDHDISESQKKHFSRFGYKPYLSYKGKIKWLSYEQHVYEKIKFAQKKSNIPSKIYHPRKHRRGKFYKAFLKIIHNNFIFIIILFLILIFLLNYRIIITFLSELNF